MTYVEETWIDDDGSGTVGTLGTAARMNKIEEGIRVLHEDGLGGANLLPDFDSAWWASGGSGIVLTWDVATPYRIRVGAKNVSKILQASVQTTSSNFLAALNPVASYLWLEPGKTYSWGVWLRSETIARQFRIRSIFFQENGTTQIATPGGEYTALVTGAVGDWIHIVRTVTAPAAGAGEKYVRFRPYVYVNTPNGSAGSPELVYLTEPVLVEGEVIPDFAKSSITIQDELDSKQAAAGELDAIAALTLAADRVVYFTGPATAAQTPLTAFARTLIDDADAATARTTLGAAAATHTHAIADITGLQAALDAKAPLADPAFTGTVLRVLNGQQIQARNAANTAWLRLLDVDSGNNLNIARDDAVGVVQLFGAVDFYDDAATPTRMGGFTGSALDFTTLKRGGVDVSVVGHTHAISDVTGLQAALDAKAPLASPTFTGEVTIADAAGGKFTMKDTDAAVDVKISRWWNSSGSTYLWLGKDDGTTKQYPVRIYHDTGRVDFDASAPVPTHGDVALAKSVSEAQTAVNASGGAAPAFGAAFQNKDTTRGAVSFYKDTTGRVHLQGVLNVKTGGSLANATIFTLPLGYRPADGKEHWFPSIVGGRVEIDNSGIVRCPNALAAGQDVTLDGISFRAA